MSNNQLCDGASACEHEAHAIALSRQLHTEIDMRPTWAHLSTLVNSQSESIAELRRQVAAQSREVRVLSDLNNETLASNDAYVHELARMNYMRVYDGRIRNALIDEVIAERHRVRVLAAEVDQLKLEADTIRRRLARIFRRLGRAASVVFSFGETEPSTGIQ